MKLPGSALKEEIYSVQEAKSLLEPMFLGGGLTLSQVSHVTGLPSYMIQNWVRRGFLPPPQQKRYTFRQLARILVINMLRDVLELDEICQIISHVNGQLDDESDDLISDDELYLAVVECLLDLEDCAWPAEERLDAACTAALERFGGMGKEDSRRRIQEGLRVMAAGAMAGRSMQAVRGLMERMKEGRIRE